MQQRLDRSLHRHQGESHRAVMFLLFHAKPYHTTLFFDVFLVGLCLTTDSSISGYDLKGVIPESFGGLNKLIYLDLSRNQISNLPLAFGNLLNLLSLNIAYNNLQSLSASQVSKLKRLDTLYAPNNKIATIPTELGALPNLTDLELSDNKLGRSVLPIISNIKSLTSLGLANNLGLKRVLPTFSNLKYLTVLILANCSFTGSIPSSYGTLPKLTQLYLGHNKLCGSVPEYFSKFPATATLDVSFNQLSGIIPASVQSKFCDQLSSFFVGNCLTSTKSNCPIEFSYTTIVCTAACYPIPNQNEDLAYNVETRQSSTFSTGKSSLAVDGTAGLGSFGNASCTQTLNQTNPWISIALKASYTVRKVQIYNRLDCCSNRLNGVQVYVGSSSAAYNTAGNSVCTDPKYTYTASQKGFPLNVTCNKVGRYVWVVIPGKYKVLSLCEVVVLK